MGTHEDVTRRLAELVAEGKRWLGTGDRYHAESGVVGWLTSAAHLVGVVSPRGPYLDQANGLASTPRHQLTSKTIAEQMLGVLRSLQVDFEGGLLRSVENIVAAETFDQFIEHADAYCRAKKKMEAAVLVSAVFEDGVRRLAAKSELDRSKKMELLVDDLVRAGTLTSVAGRRFKAVAGLRNKASHAEWDAFAIEDVEDAIRTTRQVVEMLNN